MALHVGPVALVRHGEPLHEMGRRLQWNQPQPSRRRFDLPRNFACRVEPAGHDVHGSEIQTDAGRETQSADAQRFGACFCKAIAARIPQHLNRAKLIEDVQPLHCQVRVACYAQSALESGYCIVQIPHSCTQAKHYQRFAFQIRPTCVSRDADGTRGGVLCRNRHVRASCAQGDMRLQDRNFRPDSRIPVDGAAYALEMSFSTVPIGDRDGRSRQQQSCAIGKSRITPLSDRHRAQRHVGGQSGLPRQEKRPREFITYFSAEHVRFTDQGRRPLEGRLGRCEQTSHQSLAPCGQKHLRSLLRLTALVQRRAISRPFSVSSLATGKLRSACAAATLNR